MGKKVKVGKQRQDKYYHLAKETGYRSRAAFKLIQLNKRFEFLQRSRALVDLCAAPGGWLQVAAQNMPMSSVCIGVDLVPIKGLNNCITLQGDITTEKVRQMIRKELHGWEADCVLHDGAPNIAGNWIQDAFQQNCLTLSALKLATQVLKKNGVFVTKVFRSSDYQNLVAVFEQLFKQVHVWKPAASRLESAEIFVVCEKYLKPIKVDPDLLDARKVFAETQQQAAAVNPQLLLQPNRKEKKTPALGYDIQSLTTYKEINATEFIRSTDYLTVLSGASKIILDEQYLLEHEATTEEVRQCLEDIKVCGPRELRSILSWRKKMLEKANDEAFEKDGASSAADQVLKVVDPEEEKLAEINQMIAAARVEEKAELKKRKKKMLKEKADLDKRKQLKMIIEGDKYEIPEELELFSLKKIAKAKKNALLAHGEGMNAKESSHDLDNGGDNLNEIMENTSDLMYYENDSGVSKIENVDSRKAGWFKRGEIASFVDDENEGFKAVEKFIAKNKGVSSTGKKDVTADMQDADMPSFNEIVRKNASNFEMDTNQEDDEVFVDADKPDLVLQPHESNMTTQGSVKKQSLTPELLALGEKMIYSSKTRRDMEDWAWNRYANNDDGLPDWFVEDEKKHCRHQLPVDKDRVEFYKNRVKDINTRTIKKVAEARARKQRRRELKQRQMRKRAEGILDSENMEHAEKMSEVRRMYRKSPLKEKKKISYMVMTKGKRGSVSRPKGHFKVVDARLKKDNRSEKANVKTRTKNGSSSRRRTTRK